MRDDSSDRRPDSFSRFFLPGPTAVRPEILEAQVRAMIGHRTDDMSRLVESLQFGLQQVFRTERPVFVSTSSATGLMEAGIRNGAAERVLSLVNGAFSERFADIARACGVETDVVEVPWGEHHDPQMVREKLHARRYDAVTVVHSETSTGVLQDVEALTRVVAEHDDTFLLIDSVTGVGGAEVRTDEWGVDYILTGSQKALAMPPGLAFCVASERMMERSARLSGRGLYFDLLRFAKDMERFQTPNTPAVSLLYAAEVQLRAMMDEGVDRRWERHRRMAGICWDWVERMGRERELEVSVLAPDGYRSPTVTCIRLPDDVDGSTVVERMKERGWTIGSGYGKLRKTTIRIGHMGDHTVGELSPLLRALEEVLTR